MSDAILEAALTYERVGLSVIPLCGPYCPGHKAGGRVHGPERSGKIPLLGWARFQKAPAEADHIRSWLKRWPECNIGLAMGGACGVFAWDTDGPEGEKLLRDLLGGRIVSTWEAETGRGRHRYYLWPDDDVPAPKHLATGSEALSFIGAGGYVVAPPSVHRTGAAYRWKRGPGPAGGAITLAPPEMVALIQRLHAPKSQGTRCVPRPPAPASRAALLRRAKAYAATRPGSVLGSGGRANAWSVAVDVAGKFTLSEDELVEVMLAAWGPRCTPPWTDAESLRHHIGRAATLTVVPPLPERERAPTARPAKGGNTIGAAPLGSAGQPVGSTIPIATPTRADPVAAPGEAAGYEAGNSRKTAGALMSDLPTESVGWLLPGWVPLGTLTMVSGPASAGKSTLGAHLCALAGRVVYMPEPGEAITLSARPRLIAAGADPGLALVLRGPDWVFPGKRDKLADQVRAHKARLVWIDPVDSYTGEAPENATETVRPMLEALAFVAQTTGAAVVCVRHPGKDPANLLPGSRTWGNVPRMVLELTVDEGPPVKRFIRLARDSFNTNTAPREYELIGAPGHALQWKWGPETDADSARLAREKTDTVERWKIDEACALLLSMLKDGPLDTATIYARAERERIGERMVRRAYKRLALHRERYGGGETAGAKWGLKPFPPSPDTPDTAGETPPEQEYT